MTKPPGYVEIERVSHLAADDNCWAPFMKSVLRLPLWMAPAAQDVIRQQRWKNQPNPIGYLKTATHRVSVRMGLTEDDYKGPADRSRKCPCGVMFRRQAKERGHKCAAGEVSPNVMILPNPGYAYNGHRKFVGKRFDVTDVMEAFCRSREDSDGGVEYRFEVLLDGILYRGPSVLEKLDPRLVKLRVGQLIDQGSEPVSDFHNWPSGQASLNWEKVAELSGLRPIAAIVLELRFGQGLSRERLLSSERSIKRRNQLQAAWRAIDRHWDKITTVLQPLSIEKSQRPRQIAPTRSAPVIDRSRPICDSEVLASLDQRFGPDTHCWRQRP